MSGRALGALIPDAWLDALAEAHGTDRAGLQAYHDRVMAAMDRVPQAVRDAIYLSGTSPEMLVAFLTHLNAHYVGDVDLERAIPWLISLIEESCS